MIVATPSRFGGSDVAREKVAWLLPMLVISLITGNGDGVLGIGFGSLGAAALGLVSIAAVLVLAVDSRLALACSLVWASAGLMYTEIELRSGSPLTGTVLLIACGPIMILIATVRRRMGNTATH